MKIALRIWNYNIVGIEGLVDSAVQFVLEAPTINRFFYPAQQLEIETGFAELTKSNARSRVFANLSIVGGDLLQSLNDIVDIAAISDANGNPNTVLLRRPPASLIILLLPMRPFGIVISTSSRVNSLVLRNPMCVTIPRSCLSG